MIEALIKFALNQRLILMVVSLGLIFFGFEATKNLSVDAFPDVTNEMCMRVNNASLLQ